MNQPLPMGLLCEILDDAPETYTAVNGTQSFQGKGKCILISWVYLRSNKWYYIPRILVLGRLRKEGQLEANLA